MLLECRHCGAPLDVKEGKNLVKCGYCRTMNEVRSMRTLAAQSPVGFQPPPRWLPPAHVPADSSNALPYRGGGGGIIAAVFIMLALCGAGAAVAVAAAGKSRRSATGGAAAPGREDSAIASSKLARLTMGESRKKLASTLGVPADDGGTLRVPLRDSPFSAVTFEWGDEDPQHVKRFYLSYDTPLQGYAGLRKKLDGVLPDRWFSLDGWRWEGISLYFAAKGGVYSVSVDTTYYHDAPNLHWRRQVEAMWNVTRVALLDQPGEVDKAGVRDFLGGGAPVTELARIDWEADVDRCEAATLAVFPGAMTHDMIGRNVKVPLDHPFYLEAELTWPNDKGGKLKEVALLPRRDNKFGEDQDKIIACVSSAFGVKGRSYESDYLKKSKDVSFSLPKGGALRVYEHRLAVYVRNYPFGPGNMTKANWEKLAATLDACGRK